MACLYVDAHDPEITELMMMAQEGKSEEEEEEGGRRNNLILGRSQVTKKVLRDGIPDAHGRIGLR